MQNNNDHFRLFISSTFKDMDKERSYLVEWIFPRIKELCAERGVEFFPVDLRWGITEEEGKDGKIISICIEEIDNSRPFFIGLLGERYGWRPTVADLGKTANALLNRYPWLREDIFNRLSITEMEMQYGALRNKNIDAAFYIRKSESKSLWKRILSFILSSDYRNIARLKSSIRKNHNVASRQYESLEQLGEQVYADLKVIIEREFPAEYVSQQRAMHEHSFRARLKNFVHLDHYYEQIEEALQRLTPQHRFLALHGIKGAGKSTVLCTFIEQYHQKHPDISIQYYDISKAYQYPTIGWDGNGRLKEASFLWETKTFLHQIEVDLDNAKTSQQIIVLDNLEYLARAQHDTFLRLLTSYTFPLEAKVIVTHLDYEFNPYYTSEKNLIHSYISIDILQAEKVEIFGIDIDDIPQFIEQYMHQYGKSFSKYQLEQLSRQFYATNPLYLSMVLFQFVEFGSFEELQKEIDILTDESSFKKGWLKERTLKNVLDSMIIAVAYTLDNVISRDLEKNVPQQTPLIYVIWILFIASRIEKGFTECELIEIFEFTPFQWAIFRPQILNICRLQNGYIMYNDEVMGIIWGRITDDRKELAQNRVIRYFEKIPWQHDFEIGLKKKGVQRLSAIEQAHAKQTMRKAEILPWFLYETRQFDQLSILLKDQHIRADISAGIANWLEEMMQNKNINN